MFGCPYNHSILGSILGPPVFGNSPLVLLMISSKPALHHAQSTLQATRMHFLKDPQLVPRPSNYPPLV